MCSRFRKVYHSSKETFEWYLNRDKRKEKNYLKREALREREKNVIFYSIINQEKKKKKGNF